MCKLGWHNINSKRTIMRQSSLWSRLSQLHAPFYHRHSTLEMIRLFHLYHPEHWCNGGLQGIHGGPCATYLKYLLYSHTQHLQNQEIPGSLITWTWSPCFHHNQAGLLCGAPTSLVNKLQRIQNIACNENHHWPREKRTLTWLQFYIHFTGY